MFEAVRTKLQNAKLARDLEESLDELLEILIQLDAGMVAGQVVPAEARRSAYLEAVQLAETAFDAFSSSNRRRAEQWIVELPVYLRPRELDFEALRRRIPAATPIEAIDIEHAPMAASLREQLRALRALAAGDPGRHLLHPAASDLELEEAARELRVAIPDDLKLLYRLCNGFALFRTDESHDEESSPFRLVPLHELYTYRQVIGEDDAAPKKIEPGTPPDELVDYPDRVQVFDLGNGDFLSCVHTPDVSIWIDDWHEGPGGIVADSVAQILSVALDPDRVDAGSGRWTRAWHG